jgi:signal transduction histidine kinase
MNQLFRFLLWAPSLARLLLAFAVMAAQFGKDGSLVHPAALMILIWAAISIGLVLVVQVASTRALRISIAVDVAAAALAVLSAPSTLVQALALLATSCQLLFRSGFPTYYLATLVAPLMLAPVAAGLLGASHGGSESLSLSILNQFIFAIAILNAGAAIALSAVRGDQIRQFRDQVVSIRMLRLERSLEFDLQRLVEALASIFGPNRAFCMIGEFSQHSVPRKFEQGTAVQLSEHEMRKLIGLGDELGQSEIVLDNVSQQVFTLSANSHKAEDLPEQAQGAATGLAREGLGRCIAKWVKIGRAHGIVVCAVATIDAIKIHEARVICEALDELFPLLDSVSEAERHFIADAHDVARRDLHDGVLQTLAAVRMRLLTTARRPDLKDHAVQTEVQKIADILTLEQARLRGLLETSENEDHGINLVTTLDVALRAISMQWEIDARLESEEPAIPIDKESAINIEHLVREAVANAVRHANSTQLTVRLSLHQNALQIAIIDRADKSAGGGAKRGGKSMPLKSASLLQRLRLVNGFAYAEGLDKSAILAVTIPMQRIDNA